MTNPPINIIFLHGLNTFGDDLLHLGPVTLGRMDQHLRSQFEKQGARFFSVDGVGRGSPESQARIAIRKISEESPFEKGASVFLLGNSMGGLTARSLAKIWREDPTTNPRELRLQGLLSWGTPHHGTSVAAMALEIPGIYPRLSLWLSKLGYSLTKNSSTYEHYTPASLREFNQLHPILPQAPECTFLCTIPFRKSAPYFWSLYAKVHSLPTEALIRSWRSDEAPSDGFISLESQTWGRSFGPYRLDHFTQSGFFSILPTRSQKNDAATEFEKLCFDMKKLMTELLAKPL